MGFLMHRTDFFMQHLRFNEQNSGKKIYDYLYKLKIALMDEASGLLKGFSRLEVNLRNFRHSSITVFVVLLTLVNLLPIKSFSQSPNPTVVVLPITTDTQNEKSAHDLVNLINTKLKAAYHILPQDDVSAILAGNNVANPTEVRTAMDLVQNSIESYYAYISNAKATITAMEGATEFIQKNLPPSKKSSDLMITALMTKAWLLHNTGDLDSATQILHKIFLTPNSQVQTDLYPMGFRSFVEKTRKLVPADIATLNVDSKPQGAHVYVDHVFVGVTPLTVSTTQKNLVMGFDGDGLKPTLKTVNLATSQKNLRVTLGKIKTESTSSQAVNIKIWSNLSENKKTALAEKISTLSGADKVVFLEIQGQDGAFTTLAKIYDAREKALVEALTYDKPITNFSLLKGHVANYFASELPAYLGSSQEFGTTQAPSPVSEKKKSKSGLLIGVLAGVAAAGAAGVVLAISGGGNSTTPPTPTTGSISVEF